MNDKRNNGIHLIRIGDFIKFVFASKSLIMALLVISILVMTVCFGIAYSYEKRAIKLHQDLKAHGVAIQAVSYKDHCSSKYGFARFYKFSVNGVDYHRSYGSGGLACRSPLGDSITVYYDPHNPNRNLSQRELNVGVPSKNSYASIAVDVAIIFLCYIFYKIVGSFYMLKKLNDDDPLPSSTKPKLDDA